MSHFSMSSFLCLTTRSNLFANTFLRASIALWNTSQLNADVVDPNTIAVARLYKSLAIKPKAPVRSALILPKQKTSLDVGHPKKDYTCRITDLCVINLDVDLNCDMTKGYWRFVYDWHNLIHEDIC